MHRSFPSLPQAISQRQRQQPRESLTALTNSPHPALPLRYATSRIRSNAHVHTYRSRYFTYRPAPLHHHNKLSYSPCPIIALPLTHPCTYVHTYLPLRRDRSPKDETRRDETSTQQGTPIVHRLHTYIHAVQKQGPAQQRECKRSAGGLGMSESHARPLTHSVRRRQNAHTINAQVERPTSGVVWLPAYPHRMSETPTNDVRRLPFVHVVYIGT